MIDEATGRTICGAACRTQNGRPCPVAPVTGATRCRMHGGKTPRGAASANWRTGRHSKYMPERLMERYHQALDDPELLSVRDEIALIDARLVDVLGRVDTGEAGALWARAGKLVRDLRAAWADPKGDPVGLMSQLQAVVADGERDWEAWAEVSRLIDQRARLAEAERRRLEAMQQTLSVTEAVSMVAAVLEAVRRHVTDQNQLRLVAADLGQIVALGSGEGARPGGVRAG